MMASDDSEVDPLVSVEQVSFWSKHKSLLFRGSLGVLVLVLILSVIFLGVALRQSLRPSLLHCNVPNFRSLLKVVPWKSNRRKLISSFDVSLSGLVYVAASPPLQTGDSDTELLFHQNSLFAYLCGVELPDLVLVMEIAPNRVLLRTLLFVKMIDEQWQGENLSLEQWKVEADVDECFWVSSLGSYLTGKSGNNDTVLYTLPQYNVPSNWSGIINTTFLQVAATTARATKTAEEISLLRAVAVAASSAHNNLMRALKSSDSEYAAEAYFLDEAYACLLRRTGYTGIFANAYSSAILHYVANTRDPFVADSLLLIDAGGEFKGYDTDITRTIPVSGRFSPTQEAVYNAVLAAQLSGAAVCGPMVTVQNMSLVVTTELATQLVKLGMISTANISLVKFFCPHGYFHGVGLDTHEPLPNPLLQNVVLTIEPGIYFNRVSFTNDTFARNPQIVRSAVEPLVQSGFGGIRIEDTFVVTLSGCESLSNAFKTVDEIEQNMK